VAGAAVAAGSAGCYWVCALAILAAIDSAAAIKDFIWTPPVARMIGIFAREGNRPDRLFTAKPASHTSLNATETSS
jgi:hypothetical protein